MNLRELEEFDLAIELAKNKQEQAAHFIFSRLRENNADNSRLLLFFALTSADPDEARMALETAGKVDPTNPVLPEAKVILEKQHLKDPRNPLAINGVRQILEAEAALSRPVKAAAPQKLPQETPKPPVAKPAGTTRPVKLVKIKDKPKYIPFTTTWWVRLVCSLIFFGAAMTLLYLFVTANNLNESERAYFQKISQLHQKTQKVNAQLQSAVEQFNANKLEKSELEKQLRAVIGLDEEFRLLKSPSTRFDKLDGLLGQAYSYFSEGSINLINGLENNDAGLIKEGNRLFGLGNTLLDQAREELKSIGG
jgi:hypothetical protein